MARRRPLIGINCTYEEQKDYYMLSRDYPDGIREAGGLPVFLPYAADAAEAEAILDRVDALLLTGGQDLDPAAYGAPAHPKARIMPWFKQRSDEHFARLALERDMPVLGICYGCQLLNVVLGGSLHQHLPDLPNACEAHRTDCLLHDVELQGDGLLRRMLKFESGRVNSIHHQGLDRLGRGLKATARAEDGLVEGIESEAHRFVVGVQWHPERMRTHAEHRALFEALVRGGVET